MIITIISILSITFLVWLLKNKLSLAVCPVCAGVSLTWLWMLVGIFTGKISAESYQLPVAVLMGGTVVGLMSKLEKFIHPKFVLLWKAIFVASGFTAVFSLISYQWEVFTVSVISAITLTFVFKTRGVGRKNKELEEKMKNCC